MFSESFERSSKLRVPTAWGLSDNLGMGQSEDVPEGGHVNRTRNQFIKEKLNFLRILIRSG